MEEEGKACYKKNPLGSHPHASPPDDDGAGSPASRNNTAGDGDDEKNDIVLAALAAAYLSFSEPEEYQQREDSKDGFDKRWCEMCFLSFRTVNEREEHVNSNVLRHYTCPFCRDPTIYPTRHALSREHDCTDRIACRYCVVPSWWPNRKARDEHVRTGHWTCSACEEEVVFVDGEALIRHKNQEHWARYCPWCDMLLKDEADRTTHLRERHFDCQSCRIHLKELVDKIRHIATVCHFCRLQFRTSDQKELHMQEHHSDECEDCRFQNRPGEEYCDSHGNVHDKEEEEEEESAQPETPPPEPTPEGELDLYAILKVNRRSTVEEIAKAAKKRRIEIHPDRLERQKGLSLEEKETIREKAKQVGFAADILSDVKRKQMYDRGVEMAASRRRWKQKTGFEDPSE